MTDIIILQYFSLFLIGYVGSVFVQYLYMVYYNKKGLKFLLEAQKIIAARNDKEELEAITKKDIPSLIGLKPAIQIETFVTFIILCVNCITYMFSLVAEAQLLEAWDFLVYFSSIGTAYIIISIRGNANIIPTINAICGSYNIILESYNHIDEYKEKDDDGTDGL